MVVGLVGCCFDGGRWCVRMSELRRDVGGGIGQLGCEPLRPLLLENWGFFFFPRR